MLMFLQVNTPAGELAMSIYKKIYSYSAPEKFDIFKKWVVLQRVHEGGLFLENTWCLGLDDERGFSGGWIPVEQAWRGVGRGRGKTCVASRPTTTLPLLH